MATFGATLRVVLKNDVVKSRRQGLENAFRFGTFPEKRAYWDYGNCAETYPYICMAKTYVSVEPCIPHST